MGSGKLPGVAVGGRDVCATMVSRQQLRMTPAHRKRKTGEERGEGRTARSERIVLVFSLSFLPIDLAKHPR